MLGDGLLSRELLAAYAADVAARPEVPPPAMGRDTSMCRAGCVGCPLCAGKVRPLVALRSDEAPADDRAELVMTACVCLAVEMDLRFVARLLPTADADVWSDLAHDVWRVTACVCLAVEMDLRFVARLLPTADADVWSDLAHDVWRVSMGDVDRHSITALAKAAAAMGRGNVDGAAEVLARESDAEMSVAQWYADRRSERGPARR